MNTLITLTALAMLAISVALIVAVHRADCRRNRAIVEQLSSSVTSGREMRSSGLGSRP